MENVPEVVGTKNIKHFQKWREKLEQLGYTNYCEILNAKEYGIPQNRRRCFMVSILGDYAYDFPIKTGLKYKLKDLLEKQVDEKYYLSKKHIEQISNWKAQQKPLETAQKTLTGGVIPTLTARGAGEEHAGMVLVDEKLFEDNEIVDFDSSIEFMREHNNKIAPAQVCHSKFGVVEKSIPIKNATEQGCLEAYEGDGIDISGRMQYHRGTVQKDSSQTITANGQNDIGVVVDPYTETEKDLFTESGDIKRYQNGEKVDKFKEGQMATTTYPNGYGHGPRTHNESIALNTIDRPSVKQNLRIRKLTPTEAMKLMAFETKDARAMYDANLSDSAIYHCAGDSICVNVLIAIFSNLINENDTHKPIIEKYIERVANND